MSDERRIPTEESGDQGAEREDPLAARQEFLQIFKRGAEFSEELLRENERLRFRLAELESRVGTSDEALLKELMDKVRRLEGEREELRRRFSEVEAENRDFASRYVEIENENNNLLNIYVASYQLHSTLDFEEVLRIITEIILNFIGAEVFGVAMLDDKKNALRPLIGEGLAKEDWDKLSMDDGVIRQVMGSGETYVSTDMASSQGAGAPLVCVPLCIRDGTIGVIVVYRFLQQKQTLENVDHELFTLLAGHAATAIFAARLYSDSQRKLNTIQGLIDLVTS